MPGSKHPGVSIAKVGTQRPSASRRRQSHPVHCAGNLQVAVVDEKAPPFSESQLRLGPAVRTRWSQLGHWWI